MPFNHEMSMYRLQVLSGLFYDGYFYGTCPIMDNVSVWKPNGEFIGGVQMPMASNLAASRALGGVVVGSGNRGEPARLLKVADGKISFSVLPWTVDLMGSHSLIIEG
jgi:hypothetical protein